LTELDFSKTGDGLVRLALEPKGEQDIEDITPKN